MKTFNASSSAYVLPIVLFLVIILTTGGLFSLHLAKQNIANTASFFDTTEAQIEAESQLEIIKFYAASAHFTLNRIENDALISSTLSYPDKLYIDNREHNLSTSISVRLQDSAGLLNAMYPDAEAISGLLSNAAKFESPDTIRDSIADWYDSDDLHRINGAEAGYYQGLKLSYTPRNGLIFLSREELRLIRGMRDLTDEQWQYISRFLIISPVSAFNYTTAPPELIAAKLHVSLKVLDGLIELRNEDLNLYLNRIRVIGTGYDPETSNTFPSGVISVSIVSRRNNARVTLHALIDCSNYDDAPLHTMSRY